MGTKTRSSTTTHSRDVTTGYRSGSASEVGTAGFTLPNSSRAAWVTAEMGFHSANTRSGPGSVPASTNVLAMKVSGKTTMKLALLNTSGLRTARPTTAIAQDSP